MCVLIFSTILSETFLVLRRIERHTIKNIYLAFQIFMKLEFSRHIFEKKALSNFMKIRPVGAELFHTDGRTDILADRQT